MQAKMRGDEATHVEVRRQDSVDDGELIVGFDGSPYFLQMFVKG